MERHRWEGYVQLSLGTRRGFMTVLCRPAAHCADMASRTPCGSRRSVSKQQLGWQRESGAETTSWADRRRRLVNNDVRAVDRTRATCWPGRSRCRGSAVMMGAVPQASSRAPPSSSGRGSRRPVLTGRKACRVSLSATLGGQPGVVPTGSRRFLRQQGQATLIGDIGSAGHPAAGDGGEHGAEL